MMHLTYVRNITQRNKRLLRSRLDIIIADIKNGEKAFAFPPLNFLTLNIYSVQVKRLLHRQGTDQ